ncbi:tetratricopeptide repeat protein [Alteromonas sediminis]|nr:tetratricopeptide repeat protein [Alteromonas sediminis]
MTITEKKTLRINHWHVNTETGELFDTRANKIAKERIDPIGITLLIALVQANGNMVSKDTLLSTLWPDVVVTDDALSRCVSRVRKLLGDNPRDPSYIETLPKRGYRLVASNAEWITASSHTDELSKPKEKLNLKIWPISAVGIVLLFVVVAVYLIYPLVPSSIENDEVTTLIQQADRYYHKVSRQDNEMALELYQQALAFNPNSPEAHAGLANTLVQRAIRMPADNQTSVWENTTLRLSLSDGRLFSDSAKSALDKAFMLSQKAISLAPENAKAYKALGFVLSAQNKLTDAVNTYNKALQLNPHAWDVLINMGDVHEILGQQTDAITYYKKALNAMSLQLPDEENHGNNWRADLGGLIGEKYLQRGNLNEAELWFRHVLSFAPFDAMATKGLTAVLKQTGRTGEANRLCQTYAERVGKFLC